MSLFFHRRAIEAAVAGTLEAGDEARLREHLRSCEACRAHYDGLVVAARAVAGAPDGTADELRRERARLEAALGTGARERPRRAAFVLIPATLTALAVLVVLAVRTPEREVTERGGPDDAAAPFSISVYAKPRTPDAKVRLAAEFPASGEAAVSASEWLQVTSKASVVVVAVGAAGAKVLTAGSSEALEPGTWRLFAVQGASVEEAVRAAQGLAPGATRLPLARPQVTGVLSVQP